MKTQRFVIGRHTILQNGPTLIDLTTHREFSWVTEFKVWDRCAQIGTGHVECAEISWNAGERIADDVKALVEQMIKDELPEFEEAEAEAEREREESICEIDLDHRARVVVEVVGPYQKFSVI